MLFVFALGLADAASERLGIDLIVACGKGCPLSGGCSIAWAKGRLTVWWVVVAGLRNLLPNLIESPETCFKAG